MSLVQISKSNSKMGAIPSVSLPPVKSCVNCSQCAKTCYAMKAYRLYPNVRASQDSNLLAARFHRDSYFGEITAFVTKLNAPRFFRFHVAGDILDADYLDRMALVAAAAPTVKFLAFTKAFTYVNEAMELGLFIPLNLSIVFSGWPGMAIPNPHNFPVAWFTDPKGNNPEPRITENAISCPDDCETCGKCWNLAEIGLDIVFVKH